MLASDEHNIGPISFRKLLYCLCMLPISTAIYPAAASPKAVLKTRVDSTWAIYCSNEPKTPGVRDCSAVAGSIALDSSGDWVRLAFTLTSISGDTEFTIRTPRVNVLRDGIAISADSQPIGRVFFDECNDHFCSATVPFNGHLLAGFFAADTAGFEYSTSRDQGRVITVDFIPFGKAMSELRRAVGLNDPALKEENRYLLKVKVPDETRSAIEKWGLSSPTCAAPLGVKEIKVSGRKVSQELGLTTWLSKAKSCPGNPVLVIKRKDPAERIIGQSDFSNGRVTNETLNVDAVYGFVKYKGPKDVFFEGEDGQPPIRLNQ